MKPKALKKRLVLKKETIVNLSKKEMSEMHGGSLMTTCFTCTQIPCYTCFGFDSECIVCATINTTINTITNTVLEP